MRIADIMTRHPVHCFPEDTLNRVAQLLWEHDVGTIPIVDGLGRLQGIITDRDVCMAAYTQGRALADIPVSMVGPKRVIHCREDEPLETAERLMREHGVRRLPVVDAGGALAGLLSLSDLARHLTFIRGGRGSGDGLDPAAISLTLEAVSRPRNPRTEVMGRG